MTRSDWRDSMERYEARLEPYIITTPTGDRYLSPETPKALQAMLDHLTCVGLEYGWLELTKETQA